MRRALVFLVLCLPLGCVKREPPASPDPAPPRVTDPRLQPHRRHLAPSEETQRPVAPPAAEDDEDD